MKMTSHLSVEIYWLQAKHRSSYPDLSAVCDYQDLEIAKDRLWRLATMPGIVLNNDI